MFRSDANRGLAEECGAALPTITIMDAADDEGVLVQVYTCIYIGKTRVPVLYCCKRERRNIGIARVLALLLKINA